MDQDSIEIHEYYFFRRKKECSLWLFVNENKVVLFSSIEKRLKKRKKNGGRINALYRRIYTHGISNGFLDNWIFFPRFIPIPFAGPYEASFLFFTTHRSFVFVWTVSVDDCHSLGQPLNSLLPNVISTPPTNTRKKKKQRKIKKKEDHFSTPKKFTSSGIIFSRYEANPTFEIRNGKFA